MTNSRQKGARGEREWRDFLRQEGWDARRGQQFDGLEGRDVVSALDHLFHFEVKRVEVLRLLDALHQAQDDAREDQMPVVAWKRNRHPWYVILRAEDWARLVREVEDG